MELLAFRETISFPSSPVSLHGLVRQRLANIATESIAPSTMIPEHRLAILLNETKQGWIRNCLYHNTAHSPSLYTDHLCDRANFPSMCSNILADHDDEVWFLTFSNDGRYLATAGASNDKAVYIYDVEKDFRKVHVLGNHRAGVCHIAWSPDDTKIITCSREPDCSARIWSAVVSKSILYENTQLTVLRVANVLPRSITSNTL